MHILVDFLCTFVKLVMGLLGFTATLIGQYPSDE